MAENNVMQQKTLDFFVPGTGKQRVTQETITYTRKQCFSPAISDLITSVSLLRSIDVIKVSLLFHSVRVL